jgi:glycosyltransferase involved in cell wall biosynthesis
MNLSVIIPIKDERDNLRPLHERLRAVLDTLPGRHEIVFVDDGSVDGSAAELDHLACADATVKIVRLRRNFGQSAALQAGIDHASGDIFITMDGDLQNDPADIPRLLDKLAEGYDGVLGRRAHRQDNFLFRKLPSLVANWLIRRVTGVPIRDMGCTLRALRRDVAEQLPLYGEMHRFVPVLAQHYGARLAQIDVCHHPRVAGKTKYNLTRTVRVFLDLITLTFLHSYMTRPMHVMGTGGLAAIGGGFLSLLATIYMRLAHDEHMNRNPLLLLSVVLVVVGVQMISLGLIGELLSRTYFESQGKPAYLVRETRNLDLPPHRRAA